VKQKPTIGLVMKSLQAEFFQEMKKGALAFASRQTNFNLITLGTSTQTEIDLQIELIDTLIKEKVDALVVVPIDSKALVPVIVKAAASGIKVINIDIKLDENLLEQHGVSLSYVGPDNKTAAKMVGDVLAKKLGAGTNVMIIEGLRVAENAQQRKQGFMESINEYHLNLVASEAADWETDKAAQVFTQLLSEHPDVDGVMCCNDAMALGVIRVLEMNGKTGIIPVVGFDNDAAVQPLLASGALLATIDAFGPQMAVQGIEYALKVLEGMENKGSYTTQFKLILSDK